MSQFTSLLLTLAFANLSSFNCLCMETNAAVSTPAVAIDYAAQGRQHAKNITDQLVVVWSSFFNKQSPTQDPSIVLAECMTNHNTLLEPLMLTLIKESTIVYAYEKAIKNYKLYTQALYAHLESFSFSEALAAHKDQEDFAQMSLVAQHVFMPILLHYRILAQRDFTEFNGIRDQDKTDKIG